MQKIESPNRYVFFFCSFAIVLSIWVVFLPCLKADFVNWDDNTYIYDNPVIQDFEIGNIESWKNVLTDFNPEVSFAPLTSLLFALEKEFFGFENPELWHLTSILLHIGVCLLVFVIGMKLGLGTLYACVLAIIFGIHPMRVESVAWLTEQKDTMYSLFYFLAILAYIELTKSSFRRSRYLFVLFLFILSLLSKIQAVTLPIALLLIDYLKDKEFRITHIWNKIPFLLLAFSMGMIGLLFTTGEESPTPMTFDVHNSILWVCTTLWAYLYKLVIPYPLLPIYPFPLNFEWYEYLTLLIPLIASVLLVKMWLSKNYVIFFGLMFFSINVFFTLPVIPLGQSYQADRFTYVAYFGVFFLLAYGLKALKLQPKIIHIGFMSAAIIYLVFMGFLTYQQNGHWTNSDTLWTHQIRHSPDISTPYKNRAIFHKENGQFKLAEADLDQAMRLDPDDLSTLNAKGEILISYDNEHSYNEAVTMFDRTILLSPETSSFYINRAVALGKLNRIEEAMNDLNMAISIAPENYDAYKNRAVLHNRLGLIRESITDLNKYFEYNSGDSNLWLVHSKLNSRLSNFEEALVSANKAISLDVNDANYFFERGVVLFKMGNVADAKKDIEKCIELDYNDQSEIVEEILSSDE